MKYSCIIILLLLIFGFESYSQHHQISGGMAFGSITFDRLHDFSFGRKNVREQREFRLSYAYVPQERWQYGASVMYGHSKSDMTLRGDVFAHRYVDYYGIAGETSYAYHNREKLKLYALVGAGVSFATEFYRNFDDFNKIEKHRFFEYHITPIGIRYGKKWGGFAEIGYGYRGFISIGLFYNF